MVLLVTGNTNKLQKKQFLKLPTNDNNQARFFYDFSFFQKINTRWIEIWISMTISGCVFFVYIWREVGASVGRRQTEGKICIFLTKVYRGSE